MLRKLTITFILLVSLGQLVSCNTARRQVKPIEPVRQEPAYLDHVVKYQGETLAVISAWYTGKGANWRAIQDANPGLRPEAIRLGQVIRIPQTLVVEQRPLPREKVRTVSVRRTGSPMEPGVEDGMGSEAMPTEPFSGGMDSGSAMEEIPTSPAMDSSTAEPTPASLPTGSLLPSDGTPPPTPDTALGLEPVVGSVPDTPTPPSPSAEDAEREKLLNELLEQ